LAAQEIRPHLSAMKSKICALCKTEHTTLYRIQNQPGKIWIFVCELCRIQEKAKPHYRYGGTWKGYRH
jgi:hypothetical protein